MINLLGNGGVGAFALYFSGNHLAQNTNFVTFDDSYSFDEKISNVPGGSFASSSKSINLGWFFSANDYLTDYDLRNRLNELTQGKIVFIGDFEEDVHSTYVNELQGSIILARTLQMLEEGKHLVSFWYTLLWFIVFFGITYCMLVGGTFFSWFHKHFPIRSHFFLFIVSILKFTIFIYLVSVVEYVLFDRVYSIIIPIMFFSLLKLYLQFKQMGQNENKN